MLKKLCELKGWSYPDVVSKRRNKDVFNQRVFACHFFRRMSYSLPQIGKVMNRNHTTIINMLEKPEPYDVVLFYEKHKDDKDFICKKINKIAAAHSKNEKGTNYKFPRVGLNENVSETYDKRVDNTYHIVVSFVKFKKVPNYATYKTEYEEKEISKKIFSIHKNGEGLYDIDSLEYF